MNELLDALGVRRARLRPFAALAIWVFFGAATLLFAYVQAVIEFSVDVSTSGSVTIVALVWLAWTYWHSVLFGKHRTRYVASLSLPYRRAFFVDLIPGLTISFSQMLLDKAEKGEKFTSR